MPEPNSLQEALCILVFRAREECKALEFAAILTPEDDTNRKNDLISQYRESRFPYLLTEKEEYKQLSDILDRAFARGPIIIDSGKVDRSLAKESKRRFRR